MKVLTQYQDIINEINSQTIFQNLNRRKDLLNILKEVLDKTHNMELKKIRAIGQLGVCLSLIHEECTLSQLKIFLQSSQQHDWSFNPSEFDSAAQNLILSPLEYAIRFSVRSDVIDAVLTSLDNNKKIINDTFFDPTVYNSLDIERKKLLFINHKDIDINHQHSTQKPSLVLNRVYFNDNDISQVKMLLSLGADPNLVDKSANNNFIQLARNQLNDNEYINLVQQLDDINSFYLLLYLYETKEIYKYEGLYFTFHHFYKNKDDINLTDLLRYITIMIKFNLGGINQNEDKYLDSYIYSSYLIHRAQALVQSNNDILDKKLNKFTLQIKNHFSNITIDLNTLINLQSQKKVDSKYRLIPMID